MKYYLYILLLLSVSVQAQVAIKGKVIDENKKVLSNVIVSILHPETNAVIAYEMSDDKGAFHIPVKTTLTQLKIKASAVNYSVFERTIENKSQDVQVQLVDEFTELQEIFVKASAITQHNDTLVFDLSKFAGKNDRVLEDVIKKMPGMEVKSSGEIEYQGKPLNKFYVEGKDLMQGSYGAITKALPNLHVSKLEVIENHQPIKMLEGKVASESPAINIRLKNKVSLSGSGKIGIGADPFLWNSSISPMFFSKGLQYLVSYDTNNSGDDVQNKFRAFGAMGAFDTYNYSKGTGTTLSMETTSLPGIDKSRYLFNKTHLVSANFLTKFTDKIEMNTNVSYVNDEVERTGEQSTEIRNVDVNGNLIGDVIRYNRKSNSKYFTEAFNSKFTITKNTKENYLKDYITINVSRNKERGLLLQNNDPISQSILSPSYILQNSLSTLIPVGNNKFANFKSIVDFTRDKQDYDVVSNGNVNFPDANLEKYRLLNQSFVDNTFYTQNAVSLSWKHRQWTFTEEYSLLYENKRFETNLFGQDKERVWMGSNYQNDLTYNRFVNQLNSSINFKGISWDMTFTVPIIWSAIKLNDRSIEEKNTKNAVDFSPSLYLSYKLNNMWTLRGGSLVNTSYTPLSQLYNHYIFSGLNFTAYKGKIEDTQSFTSWIRFEFKNPFNGLFANGRININSSRNKIMLAQTIDENGQTVIEAVEKKNKSNTQSANLNVGKFFSEYSSNIKGSFSINKNTTEILVNQSLRDVDTYRYNYGLQLTNNHFDWLNFTYDFAYNETERKDNSQSTYSYGNSHNVRIDLIPFKSHSFIWKLDYQESVFSQQKFANRFMDVAYRFKWDKKKIDFDFQWNNILNTKEYEQVIINSIQTSTTNFKLRPSQFLVSVRFNF
ncbi:carboxypeptidase-like regulatory domain-containing protein [Myroides sp. M-43]|uniref:carboxypeptidase-like regulatory domain-containing protein n=1 Tax=Myroides oncorhynchi TaxID=2893756 RepID=UPI001E52EED7|nr:carboxypeptidase-like regulatory domain-containing protein [Myroides oncorhynchi]MCC9043061.1 carboxypeptidase-like regulatory domain-containing protein [Myroides oncorhynchi]